MAKTYLENTLKRYLRRNDLNVTELSCTTRWTESAEDKNLDFYNVQARFKNFPINSRILSGRLETIVALRKNAGAIPPFYKGKPDILDKDQTDKKITLLIDDQLSDELRDSMVINFMRKNYDNPLDIDIKKARLEVYADKIYSYVSAIVNNDSIVYLRAIFERQIPKTEQVDIFTIIETPWILNRAEQIFSKPFPGQENYKNDIKGALFEPMRGHYIRTIGNKNFGNQSKIASITKTSLVEATDGRIKMKLELIYNLDFLMVTTPVSKGYQSYEIPVFVFYKFNFEREIWEYSGIEDLNTNDIRAVN
jgi:hypothetical protein